MSEKQNKIEKLKEMTGKGQMACDIALSLAGGDVDKAYERMLESYPSLRGPDYDQPEPEPSPAPKLPEPDKPKPKPWEVD